MSRVTTAVRAWAAPTKVGCGSLSCDLCYDDEADLADPLPETTVGELEGVHVHEPTRRVVPDAAQLGK